MITGEMPDQDEDESMTEYDFIDPDAPEKRAETNEESTEKGGADSRGFLGRALTKVSGVFDR